MAFAELGKLAIGAVTVMLVLVIGLLVATQAQSNAADVEGVDYTNATDCATSATCNATVEIKNATASISDWIPLVILVAIGGLLIALVRRFG